MTDEPIAVVGVGCRFPGGANDLRSFGNLLAAGRTCITAVPGDRWGAELHDPAGTRPGTVSNHVGAFLQDVDRFDPAYFGIVPREAQFLDPQQRMVMEVAWEAMSDSGRPRHAWRGSRTAVYVGILANDYQLIHARTLGIAGIGPHYASGVEPSFAAGRVAYAFDLHGPVATVSSACSSSLLAVHLACQALRAGECGTAVAGGVSLLLGPDMSVFMSSIGAVSKTGRCRPFDADADGLVRGEGCGFVTLKLLRDAMADSDRVYAVIRGSAVAHDGASIGLTAPNALAQQEVLLTALERAGVAPADVDYVEAHGTGTPLGDQTELDTLATVYGAHRQSPMPIGSVKAVFGHTDAAAGVAGLLKAICVVRSGIVPAQPSFASPTPAVSWRGITVSAAGSPVCADGRALRAGISSFGGSGTLVHAVLEAPEPDRDPIPVRETCVLLLSSAREEKLGEQATRMQGLVDEAGDRIGDLVASAATRSTTEAFRLAVVADGVAEVMAALADPANPADGTYTGAVLDPGSVPAVAFVYAGQGGQWPGMALDLYARDHDVRDALDECHALISAEASWSLIDELRRAGDDRRMERTDRIQPAIFAVQVAVTRWLAVRGITPGAVVGHSLGEVAAAHAAGCLSLGQAVRVVVRRAEVLHETHGTGRMYAVQEAPDAVGAVLREIGTAVTVSGFNGPRSTVIAGPPREAANAARALEERGIRCRRVPIDVATHSSVVAHCGPLLQAALHGLDPAPASIRFVSSVDPDGNAQPPDAAYWARNLTDPVRLWPAVDRLLAGRGHLLVEIGPHPVLVPALTDALRHRGRDGTAMATLRRGQPGPTALHRTVAQLHVSGVPVNWATVTGRPAQYHTLPAPSWGGGRYWLPGVRRGSHDGELAVSDFPSVHGERRDDSDGNLVSATRRAAEQADLGTAGRIDAVVRDVLALPDDFRMAPGRGLFEQGLDSLTAVSLRRGLEEEFAIVLSSSVIFEHPTITALAEFIAERGRAETASSEPCGEPRARAQPREPAAKSEDGEAIAVIGIGCRLPGASSPDAFWTLLTEGRDALGDLPDGRRADPAWSGLDANVPTRSCYLGDIAGFDAAFFRIAPREARSIDPQHRMLLEVAWDALEDAGCRPRSLQGRQVGVYVGLEAADYQQLLARDMEAVDLYYGTGTSFSAAAGRLSYFLGLNGPGIVVDTACSSALTAVHLACQGLRAGECDIAVAGGAHAIVAPTMMAAMAGTGALAPNGQCKTFDDDADGYGYGEGAVVLVLKRLAAARRDDDRVYAVIRASAINQDGASGGFTVPSASAQTALIKTALHGCGWSPADVDYVETHGTGTPLGDPIEVSALARAYGPGRDGGQPLLIGSVKPNVGHLSAAAGVVGLLKVVLALYRREIPRHLVNRPSTRIDWARLPVALVTGNRRWPERGSPARAGVSSFGFTGSNAHVLVEQAPALRPREPEPSEPFIVLPVTANSASALRTAAGLLARRLDSAPDELPGIASTATFRRSFLGHRLAVVATAPAELVRALDQVAADCEPPASARIGHVEDGEYRDVTFWYGTELPAAASRAKFGASPAYRRGLAACAEHLTHMTGETLDLLATPPEGLRLAYLFSHHVAITHLWHAYAIRPDGNAGEPATVAWAEGRVSAEDTLRALLGHEEGTAREPHRPAGVIEAVSASPESLALAVAELYVSGYEPSSARPTSPVGLPGYPWEHRPYWHRGTAQDEAPVVWPISGTTPVGLRAQIDRVRAYASRYPDADIRQIGAALASRPGMGYRTAVTGAGRQDLLRALDDAEPGAAGCSPAGAVWVFPGQGSQWPGMGLELMESAPVFAERMRECDEALQPFTGSSVIEAIRAGELERADEVQPALFAVMLSLAALWQSLGVRPAAVVGHSQGEIAAACVAGALSLEDAARIVALRSQALTEITGQGGMLSVEAGRDRVAARLDGRLSLAAVNSPRSVVISGDNGALDELAATCAADGIRTRRIQVDYASHSPAVERVRARILDVLSGIRPTAAQVPFCSALTADLIDTSQLTADYWYRSLREPVEFEQAIRRLHGQGHSVFLEISPHPILTLGLEEILAVSDARVTCTLRREQGSLAHFLGSAARAWTEGVPVHWPAIFHDIPPDSRIWSDQDTDVFWDAVERDDIDGLTAELGADDTARASLAAVLPMLASWRRGSRGQPPTQSLCYHIIWRPAPVATSVVSGTWLVVAPRAEAAAAHPWVKGCVAALTSGGANVRQLTMPFTPAEIPPIRDMSGVVSLLALDENPCAGYPMITQGLADTATLIRVLGEASIEAPMWFLTCGAAGAGKPVARPAQAEVLGFTRVLGLDIPGRWGGQIDLPPAVDDLAKDRLRAALSGVQGEDQFAVRDTGLLVRRLVRARPTGAARRWNPRGTVLVTGGTGDLGRHVARWLAREGADHLLLVSRQGPQAPGAHSLLAELTQTGTRVTITACDVTDRDALGELVAAHSPTSVFHIAGVIGRLDAKPGDDMTEFAHVLAAKVTGAANLHAVFGRRPLDAFVLFSSIAGVWGSSGQGAYAAGNAHLDALAEARRADGLPATSVAWGAWAGAGIAATAASVEFLQRRGIRTMPPELTLRALRYVLERGETCVSVADMDWDRFADSFAAARDRPLISEMVSAGDQARTTPRQGPSALAGALAALPAAAREQRLLALVCGQTALVLGHDDPALIKADRKFQELGFDSLSSVELCKRLRQVTGLALPRSVVYDHPTPIALAARLDDELIPDAPADGDAADRDGDGRIDVMDVAQLVRMARPEVQD